jgi:uncharacterized membrane protein
MIKTIVGSFDSNREAQQVVQELGRAGIAQDQINLIASNIRDDYAAPDMTAPGTRTPSGVDVATGSTAATAKEHTSGAAAGAVTGGVIGGVAGFALAFTSLTIPVVGPVIAAGPIVATLTGAGVGAVAGGLIGGLTDIGVPREHAEYYAEAVRRGGALVTVRVDDARTDEVTRVMQRHGAIDINKRAETWRTSGWEGFDEAARPYTIEDIERERAVDTRTTTPRTSSEGALYAEDFRTDFDRDYAGRGMRYEDYEPAYRWGFENAEAYDSDWDASEADLRRDWERGNPGGEWERFKDAVRRGWERFKAGSRHAVGADDDVRRTRA